MELIAAKQVIVKDGVSYVDATGLAKALGAVVRSARASVIITSSQPNQKCDKSHLDGQRFSDEFRSDTHCSTYAHFLRSAPSSGCSGFGKTAKMCHAVQRYDLAVGRTFPFGRFIATN